MFIILCHNYFHKHIGLVHNAVGVLQILMFCQNDQM